MELKTYVRKPFTVQAVEITKENIADVAKLVGKLKYNDNDGTPYIQVDRNRVPNVYKVFIGFWMTQMGKNVRCYSPEIFLEQFVEINPELAAWVEFLDKSTKTPEEEPAN